MTEPSLPEESIFAQALDIGSAADRAAFLDRACGDDPDLRAEVEALLRADARSGDLLDLPESPAGTEDLGAGESLGSDIGPYKLLEQIGEGGFGVVFLAEQTEPVRRKVALKVLKRGMDTKQVVARFEAERQALALMDHPNIARIHDGGTTADGRPYFVMELVKGVPITDYADRCGLTTRERLDLFLSVCQAVQHAHQKGVIHRDLKPPNVLVAMQDGRPAVKVIDFGVAKAVSQRLSEHTLQTGFHQMIGTPLYMSPEQAEMSPLDVDTRADVYALGVLLYELLTGTTPFERERLRKVGYDEIRRIIREEEPPRPSARLSTLQAKLTAAAAQRRTEPRHLMRAVRGELDWIAMKCLEKDRTRRYETASGLAMDVQRHLADEPVLACPPSAGYRLWKFVRRHRSVLTAALAFVLLLLAGVVALSVALVAVNRERQEKEAALEAEGKRRKQTREALDAMSSQIIEDWLARQAHLLPEHRRFLEQALHSYEEFATDTGHHEESRAGVASASRHVAAIRKHLGQWTAAGAAWERSRDLYAGLVADFPHVPSYRRELAAAQADIGAHYHDVGRGREAEAALTQGLAIHRALAAEFPDVPAYRSSMARDLNILAGLLNNLDRKLESETAYREALAIKKRLVAELPTVPRYRDQLAQSHLGLGLLLQGLTGRSPDAAAIAPDRSNEATESLAEAVAVYKQLAADFPYDSRYRDQLATCLNNLGNSFRSARRHGDAEGAFDQALAIRTQLVAEFPGVPNYRRGRAIVLNNLGILLKNTDRPEKAEELYRQTVTVHKQLAADFPDVPNHQNEAAGAMVNLARMLLARNDPRGARALLKEAVPYHQAALKASPSNLAYRNFYRLNCWRTAEALLELKDHAAAAAAAEQFLQTQVEPPRDAYTAAGLLAGCVRLAAEDESLAEDSRRALATTYGDRALAALRRAIDKGATEVAKVRSDPSLDPLRTRDDFQKLLTELDVQVK